MLGVFAALCAGASYGSVLALSKLTFAHDVRPLTLVVLRYAALTLVLGLWLGLRRRFTRLSMATIAVLGLIGLFSYIITAGNLNSVRYIPVSLTTLVFYTHPILVAVVSGATGRARVGSVELAAAAAALCGLFITLQVSFESAHPLGIAFACASSLSVLAMFVVSDRVLQRVDPLEVTFYMAASALLISCATLPIEGGITAPSSATGFWLVALVTVLFMVAISATFYAIRLIGPMLSSMMMNVEPLCAITVAVIFLGESTTTTLLVGALLVVSAIVLMQASQSIRR